MNPSLLVKKTALALLIVNLVFGVNATRGFATENQSESTPDGATKHDKSGAKALREEFAKRLTGTTLVGNFTTTGKEKNDLTAEQYELLGVQHVEGEHWLFQARIRYGEHDVTLPITLPVRWAGDTPVICVDNMGFPGLGTYTARVMIYADHYAGFWSGKDHGGHLFGVVRRSLTKEVEK